MGSRRKITASILVFHQQRADLQVAAQRAGMLAVHRQPQFGGQPAARGAGGGQRAAAQEAGVFAGQRDHVVFLPVVGDQGNAGNRRSSLIHWSGFAAFFTCDSR
jgi:hypothetical protein